MPILIPILLHNINNLDLTETIEKDPLRNKGINYKTNEIYLLCSKNKNNIYKYGV